MTNKNTTIEETIIDTVQKIETMQRTIAVAETLPELRGILRAHISPRGALFLTAAFDLETYRHNRRILGADGWRATDAAFVGDGDSRQTDLVKDGHRIVYCMDSDIDGSTCKREQIGTETVPVYRVACKRREVTQ